MSEMQRLMDATLNIIGQKESHNIWALLAKYGRPGLVKKFTTAEMEYLTCLKRLVGGCPIGFCYMNAQKMALAARSNNRIKYVEGLVTVHDVPLDHAWIELNGKVYDPTLTDNEIPEIPHEYQGITVPKGLILKHQHAMQTYSPLTYSRDLEILKKIWKNVNF